MSLTPARESATLGQEQPSPLAAAPLRALRVSGVVVRKADLIEVLRVYAPGLTDIQVTEDGEHFWLLLGGVGPVEGRERG